jgi:hypothetical protein
MAHKSKVSDRFPSRDVFFGTSPDLPRIVELDVAKIVWNPDQPRRSIDPDRLQELADSIAANGLIHPITVKLRISPQAGPLFRDEAGRGFRNDAGHPFRDLTGH